MSGNLKLIAASVAFGAALAGLSAPAGAKPPAGSASTCPAAYEAYTLSELIALGEANGVPQDRVEATFGRLNKNADAWVCVAVVPQSTGFNFIDNQAVGLDR
jgi:hypothetical protein